jgi:predicted dehydrogenase
MTFGWGIAGTGRIARTVGGLIAAHPGMTVAAVTSRDRARAAAFADELGASRSNASYDELVSDPAVQAVYVATPHAQHAPVVEAALAAGKAVLCEKPLTDSLAETERLVGLAQRSGVFLMEAMWMRFNPLVQQLAQLAGGGGLGELRSLTASFGFAAPYDVASRLWNPDLGGGALLDVGVYVVDLARLLLGEPESVSARGAAAPTGVDSQATVSMRFPGGAAALLDVSLLSRLPGTATLVGTRGYAELSPTFHAPTRLRVEVDGEPPREHTLPDRQIGFVREVEEVVRCVTAGRPESEVLPLTETVATMRLLDEASRQVHG